MNSKFFPTKSQPWRHAWAPAALLAVRGEDALGFLQGQFSQDLLAPTGASRVAYGLWLNHKGRILADSFALVVGPAEVWLVSYFSPGAGIRGHLESHIIADDVTVEDHTEAWSGLAVGGAGAAGWLQASENERLGSLPPPGEFVRAGPGFVFRGRRDREESWEWVAPKLVPAPAGVGGSDISPMTLELIRLTAGIPAVPVDLGPGDLPPEGGLEAVAVSHTKGCYLGQEIMARLRTGKIRRRLFRVGGTGAPPVERPTPLWQAGRRVGELRSVAPDDAGGWVGLAMLTLLGLDRTAPLTSGTEPAGAELGFPDDSWPGGLNRGQRPRLQSDRPELRAIRLLDVP